MHAARLYPTLFHDTRSRPSPPPMHERWGLAQLPDRMAPYSPLNIYSPIMCALSPRDCRAELIRYPVAAALQLSVDILAGVSAVGFAALLLLANRRDMAQGLICEHKINIVLAAVVIGQSAVAGAAFGVIYHLLA